MKKSIDVGMIMDQIKSYFNFKKALIIGIHKEDGSYITAIDEQLTDNELILIIQALKDAREKRKEHG